MLPHHSIQVLPVHTHLMIHIAIVYIVHIRLYECSITTMSYESVEVPVNFTSAASSIVISNRVCIVSTQNYSNILYRSKFSMLGTL